MDDVGVECETVDDGCGEAFVGECFVPFAEGCVCGYCDAGSFFSFGEDLEEEFGGALV